MKTLDTEVERGEEKRAEMLREGMKHGFTESAWSLAKMEARQAMIERARVRGMIPYSDLVRRIHAVALEAHDPRLFHMLGEISSEEDVAGRGMLTVVVVHKAGDMQPGPGFFELANHLGRDTTNILQCWVEELHRVHAVWSRKPE